MATIPTLKLIHERKMCELISCHKPVKRWEASGVVTVSDRRKRAAQPDKTLSEKDQSVHVFDIPSAIERGNGQNIGPDASLAVSAQEAV